MLFRSVKGFEYDTDQYVIMTDDDFEKIKTEKDKSIQILHFANLNQISPVYYDKTYHAVPNAGGEKAFELLRTAMMEEEKIAIGKTVMGNSETLLAIIPREEGIIILTMHYAAEIKEFQKKYSKPKVSKQELDMAKTLISPMDTPFEPEQYTDVYQAKLRELIENKIAGKEVVAAKTEEQDTGKVIDLMEALKASVKKAKKEKETA